MNSEQFEPFGDAAQPLSSVPAVGRDNGGHRIYVVDDDPLLLQAISRLLTYAGYSVTKSHDPILAYQSISESPSAFDLVVTELRMPRMDGHELIWRLKKAGADLPFMVCSGAINQQENNSIADYYFPKPVDRERFLKTISSLIRNHRPV